MRMRLLVTVSLLVLVFLTGPPQKGESVSGQVRVGARVMPHVRWNVRDVPVSLHITEEDIERGSVDIVAARLRVQTNDPGGFLVVATIAGDEFASGELIGFDRPIVIGAGGGFAHNVFRGTAPLEQELRWRLPLRSGSVAGSHAWPLRIEVRQLRAQRS